MRQGMTSVVPVRALSLVIPRALSPNGPAFHSCLKVDKKKAGPKPCPWVVLQFNYSFDAGGAAVVLVILCMRSLMRLISCVRNCSAFACWSDVRTCV